MKSEIVVRFSSFSKRCDLLLNENGIHLSEKSGILVALSGGADSVFLLFCLIPLSKQYGFPIHVLHVEHGIRGKESIEDASFCKELCKSLSIPCHIESVSVPSFASAEKLGIEEAARTLRYEALYNYAKCHPELSYITTAHNRDDLAETVLFRLLRGCGGTGASGIPFQNGQIIRPILSFSSKEIRNTLDSFGYPYVVDSTNLETEYTRNYLRREIIPRLKRISNDPAKMISLSASHIREDSEYLDEVSNEEFPIVWGIRSKLRNLPNPILKRILKIAFSKESQVMPEAVHIEAACSLIRKEGDGYISFPSNLNLCVIGDHVSFSQKREDKQNNPPISLTNEGETVFIPFSNDKFVFYQNRKSIEELVIDFLFVHKNAKKAILSSATIVGNMFIRSPLPGDKIVYNGSTHELRKIFTSKKIPREKRTNIPLLCDDLGVLWVPGVAVRDGCDGRNCGDKEKTVVFSWDGISELFQEKQT